MRDVAGCRSQDHSCCDMLASILAARKLCGALMKQIKLAAFLVA